MNILSTALIKIRTFCQNIVILSRQQSVWMHFVHSDWSKNSRGNFTWKNSLVNPKLWIFTNTQYTNNWTMYLNHSIRRIKIFHQTLLRHSWSCTILSIQFMWRMFVYDCNCVLGNNAFRLNFIFLSKQRSIQNGVVLFTHSLRFHDDEVIRNFRNGIAKLTLFWIMITKVNFVLICFDETFYCFVCFFFLKMWRFCFCYSLMLMMCCYCPGTNLSLALN